MADQINRIVLLGVDSTGPAVLSAKQNLASLGNTAQMSARQMTAAMRGVPAQVTDIVTSLASGQRPLTVLLQQGGQLKDMFGGVVPAAKALGATILGLLNPVTLVAGAAGAMAVAWFQGQKESQELNRVLILTGNYAGQTRDSLAGMAEAMAATGKVTRSDAADALVAVISTGRVASGQLQTVAEAAVNMSKVTGESVKDVVAKFVQLGEEPAKAAAKLNEQYHFLTASVYGQIRALEEQGRKEEAAAVAQAALAQAAKDRALQVSENLGVLEKAWNLVGKAAKLAWDTMMDIGRDRSLEQQLTSVRDAIRVAEGKDKNRPFQLPWQDNLETLRQREAFLQEVQRMNRRSADLASTRAATNKAAIEAQGEVDALLDQARGLSAVDRELEKLRRNLDAIKAANPEDERLLEKNVKAAEAAIRKRFAGPKPSQQGQQQAIDAQLKQLQGALQTEERATKQSLERIRTTYDLGLLTTKQFLDQDYEARQQGLERQIEIARRQEEIARGKNNVAAVEQYKNEQKRLADQIEANFIEHNSQLELLAAKRQRAVLDYQRTLDVELRTRQGAIDDSLAGAGLSARQRDERQRLLDVQRDFERRREELERARGRPEAEGGISQDVYERELRDLQDFYEQRLQQERDYNAKSQVLREDWRVGARQAFADYVDTAKDAAGQSGRFFGNVLQGMEDALVQFATTGKLNFRSLANVILAEMARVEARRLVTGIFGAGGPGAGLLGQLGSLIWSGGGGIQLGGINPASGEFMGSLEFAKGGVLRARGLSAYSSRIIDRPTIFALAKGAGLMGEAGPEAVMPLRRGRDGRLGVDAGGGLGVNVTVQNLGPAVDVVETRRNGDDIEVIINRAVDRAEARVADSIADPNSRISRRLGGSTTAGRRRS